MNWAILLPAQSFWVILVARFISGIGSAGAITVVSIYNNEVASPLKKASLGNFINISKLKRLVINKFHLFSKRKFSTNCVVLVYLKDPS